MQCTNVLDDYFASLVNPHTRARGVHLEARSLSRRLRNGVELLHDISLRIEPGELVAVIGHSGAGKTTLLDALAGYKPATSGGVYLDGVSLYDHFSLFRNQVGYVPQSNIIHQHLTVWEALDYTAQLRLPPGTPAGERHQRVNEVIDDLGLTDRRSTRVRHLSGGQQKRVSIGAELITSPPLFFLDEPTSGLDPNIEAELMRLLRRLARDGRTIILSTHLTKNIALADKVVVLTRTGRCAWYGPPDEALRYFAAFHKSSGRNEQVIDFDDIYGLLDSGASPGEWAARYRMHGAASAHVAAPPLQDARPAQFGVVPTRTAQVSPLHQLVILATRNLQLLTRDHFALVLILLVPWLLAGTDFLITTRGMFDPVHGDSLRVVITIGTLIVNALLVGALTQMREIIKDANIYRRERMVNLRLSSYLLSKVAIAAGLAAYQAIPWVAVRYLAVQMPGGLGTAVEMYVTVMLIVLAGMMLGLLASAVAPSEDSVALIVALLIIPQVLFNGSLLPLPLLSPMARTLTAVMPARWGFEALLAQSGIGDQLVSDPNWRLPAAQRDLLTTRQLQTSPCLGSNILRRCRFPGIQAYAALVTPAVSRQQHTAPAGIRSLNKVNRPYQQRSLVAAQAHATAEAEGALQTEYANFGGIYNSSLLGHWLALLIVISALAAGTLGIQRTREMVW